MTLLKQNAGVRQGDPLSGHIFNAVIDYVYSQLHPDIGFTIGEVRVKYLAFADDGILFAETETGLKDQLSRLVKAFRECGMVLNPKKCLSVALVKDTRVKKIYLGENSFLNIDGQPVPAMKSGDSYKYLGCSFGPDGLIDKSIVSNLEEKLGRLSRS